MASGLAAWRRGMDLQKGEAMGLQLSFSPKLQAHFNNLNFLVIAMGIGSSLVRCL